MSSKAITETTERRSAAGRWQTSGSGAPSLVRTDDPTLARVVGMAGAILVVAGGLVLLAARFNKHVAVGPGWATFFLASGLAGLLLHAAFDWDVQFRRVYMAFGYLALLVGVVFFFVPYPRHVGDQFGGGFLCLSLSLLFLLAFLRNETDEQLRQYAEYVIGGAGAVLLVVGLIGSNIKSEFLLPYGGLLAILGIFYLAAFVSLRGIDNDLGYWAGIGLGVLGLAIFLVALGRSTLPPVFFRFGWVKSPPIDYHIPYGVILMALGLLCAGVSAALTSERSLVVLTRRELGAFFFSPIFFVLLGAAVIAHGVSYLWYVSQLLEPQRPAYEPIVAGFVMQWPTVLFTICFVPVLTMRLLSEEKRSGTLEVLLTAPVGEAPVVISKFLAAWLVFLFLWTPFVLYLVFLRMDTGSTFDYRPLLSFFVSLCVIGAGFVSMGLFFSSLTSNQIASGVLALVGMVVLTLVFLASYLIQQIISPDSAWATVLTHMSYLDIWDSALKGKLVPRLLLFYASLAVFTQFLTVKVLEARRWL